MNQDLKRGFATACLALLLGAFSTSCVLAQAEEGEVAINATILLGEPSGRGLAGDELEQIVLDVASRLRCPVCQGLSVDDSQTDTAIGMRAEARELLAAGFTAEQTMQYFEQSYGEFIRLEPKAEGFNRLVWIAPVAGLLLGFVVIIARLRGQAAASPRGGGDAAAHGNDDPELDKYLARVRREIGQTPEGETT